MPKINALFFGLISRGISSKTHSGWAEMGGDNDTHAKANLPLSLESSEGESHYIIVRKIGALFQIFV